MPQSEARQNRQDNSEGHLEAGMKRRLLAVIVLLTSLPLSAAVAQDSRPLRIEDRNLTSINVEYAIPVGPVSLAPEAFAGITAWSVSYGGGCLLYPLSAKGNGLLLELSYTQVTESFDYPARGSLALLGGWRLVGKFLTGSARIGGCCWLRDSAFSPSDFALAFAFTFGIAIR